ncbi:WxL protein peptidoglycan domain-containing protein [Streptomyces sp. H27-D2]|uniref:WxL protein peptidoglycan domain-containing protein n=1 Tax=Streptomyces sp. H27-D2 TaxID=3046304 RepID=UPI002DBA448B|nr:DUF916 domain-containing protein [Streptomyces sp. H27-D2]MEC4018781.1 DUF916 domain-containing protein [Streptomyces sp. H27-D2]
MPTRTRTAAPRVVAMAAAALLYATGGATDATAAPDDPTSAAQPVSAPPPARAWSAEPAPSGGTRPSADDRPYFYLEGGPGTVLQDKLSVTNPTREPIKVTLRGADAYNAEGGSFAVREAAASTDTGAWISLAATTVEVPARTRADVPFSVAVPADAVPGDHPGAIVATAGGREVGVRAQLRVSGPTLSAIGVEKVSVRDTSNGAEVRYTLVNRGNTALAPRLAVRADGVFGEVLSRKARDLPVELLPGQRVRLTEKWPDPPALDSVDVRLTVNAGGGARGSASAAYTAAPWGLPGVGLALLAALGAGAGFGARRLRRRGGARSEPDSGAEQPELPDPAPQGAVTQTEPQTEPQDEPHTEPQDDPDREVPELAGAETGAVS